MFQLEYPLLLLLLPAPLLVFLFFPPAKRQETAVKVPFYDTLTTINHGTIGGAQSHTLQRLLAIILWTLLVFAACRPQWVGDPIPLPTSGRDLMMSVDISESMLEEDMEIRGREASRIDVVKLVVSDFVKSRVTDRLGLILFGTQAYLQVPLTFDRETVNRLLIEARPGFAGPATAIGDSIGLAIKRLKQRPEASRVLILLTDGQNTAGEVSPRDAADLAKVAGVKIYTIGVASSKVLRSFFSVRRADADLDENMLNYIAEQTGGKYFRAKDAKELTQIYDELNKIEPIEQNDEVFRPISALYYWPLALAIFVSFYLAALHVNIRALFSRTGHANAKASDNGADTHILSSSGR